MSPATIRLLGPDDVERACALINRVFDAFEAPDYVPEGVAEFRRYANAAAMRERLVQGHFALGAACDGVLVGAIEVRNASHISMLFVEASYHRRGIARALWDAALARCCAERPQLEAVTVNSSPYAVGVYERLGFVATAGEQLVNGIRFIPMRLTMRG